MLEAEAAAVIDTGFRISGDPTPGRCFLAYVRGIAVLLVAIFQSSASNEKKLIWIVAVVLLPVLGLILWYFLGPRNGKSG